VTSCSFQKEKSAKEKKYFLFAERIINFEKFRLTNGSDSKMKMNFFIVPFLLAIAYLTIFH